MSRYFDHNPDCVLYVCCGSKCRKKGGKQIFKSLKARVKNQGLRNAMQVIKTGCTDRCKMGPVIAAMPFNEWYLQVSEEKANEIFDHVVLARKI